MPEPMTAERRAEIRRQDHEPLDDSYACLSAAASARRDLLAEVDRLTGELGPLAPRADNPAPRSRRPVDLDTVDHRGGEHVNVRTLAAGQVKLRRDLAVEFQRLLLDSDSATHLLAGWLDTTITVSVVSHSESYEPTYQQRRQLLYYQPTGECWKRVAWLATADGTRISHATTIILPERLDPQQQAAIREGTVPLGTIWSGVGVRRHARDERDDR